VSCEFKSQAKEKEEIKFGYLERRVEIRDIFGFSK
jgi:hypothetical protein